MRDFFCDFEATTLCPFTHMHGLFDSFTRRCVADGWRCVRSVAERFHDQRSIYFTAKYRFISCFVIRSSSSDSLSSVQIAYRSIFNAVSLIYWAVNFQ